jgi:4-amino-4-deoxy-L-arabinose transferase-like glycosyltransferase
MSALFGTLVIPATWFAAYRMTLDRQISIWAALLTALSPPMVFLSREARVYPLLALCAVMATLYASEIIRRGRFRDWLGFTVACSVMPHLHYYGFFYLAVVGILVLWSARSRFGGTLWRLTLAYIFMGLAFLPGLNLFLTQLGIVQKVAVNSLVQILYFPVYVLGGRTFIWKQDGMGLVAFAEVLVIFGIWIPVLWRLRNDKQAPWLAFLSAAGVFLMAAGISATYMSMFNARYVSFIVPLLLIAIAYALINMVRARQTFSVLPCVILSCLIGVSLFRMYTEVQKDDWRGLSQYIAERGPDLPVVFYEDIGALTFAYYRPDQQMIQLFEPFDRDGASWESAGYAQTMSELPEYWLVISPIWSDEVPREVTQWCRAYGELLDQKQFKGLYLARFSSFDTGDKHINRVP